MTTDLDLPGSHRPTELRAVSLRHLIPGAAGLLYAGVQLDGGITAAAYRGISTVPHDRLNFPFAGSLATATSLVWGLSQAFFLLTLTAFARSRAIGDSRSGRTGAWLSVMGCSMFVAAHAVSLTFRDARTDAPAGRVATALFAGGSLLTAVGLVMAGLAVVQMGRWTTWRRYPALAVGLWMCCLLPLQFTALLPLAVAIYALTVATFAVALLAEPESATS